MKQLVLGVLLAATISLGYRLVGTFNATAGDAPKSQQETPKVLEPKEPIQPAAGRVDRSTLERNLSRSNTGPDRTRRGEEASKRSRAVPRSAAKPILGERSCELASSRTPPQAVPEGPRMIGPDGIVFHRIGAATLAVSTARLAPSVVAEEPIVKAPVPQPQKVETQPVAQLEKPMSVEPIAPAEPIIVPVRGRMIGPDGIEYHLVPRSH